MRSIQVSRLTQNPELFAPLSDVQIIPKLIQITSEKVCLTCGVVGTKINTIILKRSRHKYTKCKPNKKCWDFINSLLKYQVNKKVQK